MSAGKTSRVKKCWKMVEGWRDFARLLPGNWIYNFVPSFKCPLLLDKSCLPIIRRHVNSSLARSLVRRAFLWKRLVLQCSSPLTSTFINDVELSSTSALLYGFSLPPRCPVTLSSFPFLRKLYGEINSFLFPYLFIGGFRDVIIQRNFSLFFLSFS